MLKVINGKIKHVKKKEDRDVIEGITQTRIFSGEVTVKEIAIMMRIYREVPK